MATSISSVRSERYFEEGWAEIDHQMNYPDKADCITRGYLSSLNYSTHTANEIAWKLETLKHIPYLSHRYTELRMERGG